MSIQDHHINRAAAHAREMFTFNLPTAPTASSSNIVFGRLTPGYKFYIVSVQLYGLSFTTLTSCDCGIAPTGGGTFTSALSAQVTPVADTERFATLSTTPANLYATATTSQIIVKYTTGAAPATVNAFLTVIIRPRPLDGDPVV